MKRNLVLSCAAVLLALAPSLGAAVPNIPFGSHLFPYATSIKPNSVTQAQLDNATKAFYTNWKAAYLQQKCAAGQYRIDYGGDQTVSEAHGYGMLTMVLMAGYDAQ